jgi:hypothetical protein
MEKLGHRIIPLSISVEVCSFLHPERGRRGQRVEGEENSSPTSTLHFILNLVSRALVRLAAIARHAASLSGLLRFLCTLVWMFFLIWFIFLSPCKLGTDRLGCKRLTRASETLEPRDGHPTVHVTFALKPFHRS